MLQGNFWIDERMGQSTDEVADTKNSQELPLGGILRLSILLLQVFLRQPVRLDVNPYMLVFFARSKHLSETARHSYTY